uniref:transcription termination factor 1 n=1 Tax=Myxine glutinosa TaxID=7769 RepID=UPI00358E21E4
MGKTRDINARRKKSRKDKERQSCGDDGQREALNEREEQFLHIKNTKKRNKRSKRMGLRSTCEDVADDPSGCYLAGPVVSSGAPQRVDGGSALPDGSHDAQVQTSTNRDVQPRGASIQRYLMDDLGLGSCERDVPKEHKMRLLEEMIPHFSNMSQVQVEKALKYDMEPLLLMKSKGQKLHFGHFSKAEVKTLQRNVEAFMVNHPEVEDPRDLFIPPEDQDIRRSLRKLKRDSTFHICLGQDLLRLYDQLLHRAAIMYEGIDLKSGRLTASEKNRLLKLQKRYGNNWRQIGDVMQRGSKNLGVLHKHLLFAPKKGVWSVEETHQLINAMKAFILRLQEEEGSADKLYTRSTLPLHELCPPNIPWADIAFIVQTRNNEQCRQKWLEMVSWTLGRIAPAEQRWHLPASSIRFITVLHNQGVADEAHLKWEAVSHEMCEIPARFLQRQFFKLKELHVPLWRHKSFGELTDYLNKHVLPKLQKQQERLDLKKLHPACVSPEQDDVPVQTLQGLLHKLFSTLEASVKEPEADEEVVVSS